MKKHAKGQQILSLIRPTYKSYCISEYDLRTLMAITAKFDLETTQIDAVNAFIHYDLDEKKDKVLRLRKALYGLRRSPL